MNKTMKNKRINYSRQPSYQQRHVLLALAPMKRQRFEYLILKLGVEPYHAGGGTGTVNYYSLKNVLQCKIGDILTKWGFSFDRIKNCFGILHEKFPDFFDEGTYLADQCKSIENALSHLLLFSKVYSHGEGGNTWHEITFYQHEKIGKYEDLTQVKLSNANDKLAAFLNEQGFFVLDLSELKTLVTDRLTHTQDHGYILPPDKK